MRPEIPGWLYLKEGDIAQEGDVYACVLQEFHVSDDPKKSNTGLKPGMPIVAEVMCYKPRRKIA